MTASIVTPRIVHLRQPWRPRRAIALHCSGIGASQWRYLEQRLAGRYEVLTPEHYGCESGGPWTGEHAFRLADEAARALALIDGGREKVHLIGHAYGGAVALSAASARPDRIASLALYEPTALHLLRAMGDEGATALEEVAAVARKMGEGVIAGDYVGAAALFFDCWCGAGAWARLQPWMQTVFIRWAVKAPLECHALMEEPTPPIAYAGLSMPILVMLGEQAPRPARLIAGLLSTILPNARLAVVDGAGHMGPLTHAAAVNALVDGHMDAADAAAFRSRRAPGAPFPRLAAPSR